MERGDSLVVLYTAHSLFFLGCAIFLPFKPSPDNCFKVGCAKSPQPNPPDVCTGIGAVLALHVGHNEGLDCLTETVIFISNEV